MAKVLTRDGATTILRSLGWRVRTTGEYGQVVRHFQGGWALGAALAVDGIVGPKTTSALMDSYEAFHDGKPTAGPHFSFAEFACRCRGQFSACPRIWVRRDLIRGLERLRALAYPQGLVVVSGCRCEGHNKAVQGAPGSQHKYGAACDMAGRVKVADVRALAKFSGIGYKAKTGLVTHVDVRHLAGHNTTKSTTSRPATWPYDS